MNNIMWPFILKVSQKAAIFSAKFIGKGDNIEADRAAVTAMRDELNKLPFHFKVVIGEGERDNAPMLFIGETLGKKKPIKNTNIIEEFEGVNNCHSEWHIAVDPLEGTNLCSKNLPGAITAISITEKGGIFSSPDIYMLKLAVGPEVIIDDLSFELSIYDLISIIAHSKNIKHSEVTIAVLERDRHNILIDQIYNSNARVKLLPDGDLAACIATCLPWTGIDAYVGIGGAPEGVISASAIKILGGFMIGRLMLNDKINNKINNCSNTDFKNLRINSIDYREFSFISDEKNINDLVPGKNITVVISGVTDGYILDGVKILKLDNINSIFEVNSVVFSTDLDGIMNVRSQFK
ncbi:fructose-bisphosphatase class II family protein [Lyticum sinuosum]|uniref:Fructose-1,6-bisphosphatase n=1 Tax=Lyticum sinuosum TaxID=1332059 RepID=A0AAE5AHQ4_9RICK|nr:fructose-bisphosphatase class II family protein [Lyticum sinuosum]MDZ5761014.1 Fructose 1,6-bisphosphatase [Lyticum sinuosum]